MAPRSVLVVFAGYAVLIEAWRRVVLSMGEQLPFWTAARIWFLRQSGKVCARKGVGGRRGRGPCPAGRS